MFLGIQKPILLSLILSLVFGSCTEKTVVFDRENIVFEESEPGQQLYKSKHKCCRDYQYYIPSDSSYEQVIRLKLHIAYGADSVGNISIDKAEKYFKTIIRLANEKLANNQKMALPPNNETPVLPVKYRYEVIPDYGKKGDKGIHYIFDDSLAYYVHKGKNKNHYSRAIAKKYAIQSDYFLNVFFMPYPPDSILSPSFSAHNVGIALGTSIKVAGDFIAQEKEPWKFASLLNHEVGHVLGLSHTWGGSDGCEDTPAHNNCYGEEDNDGPCGKGKGSNNVMDYNHSQMAFTPCQLGRVHENFMLKNSKQRGIVRRNWCSRKEDEKTMIKGAVHWRQDRDLRGDLILEENASLRIYCRLSIPENGNIILEKGSHLILDNCQVHNSCDLEWKGFFYQGKGKKQQAKITFIGSANIDHTKYNPYAEELEE